MPFTEQFPEMIPILVAAVSKVHNNNVFHIWLGKLISCHALHTQVEIDTTSVPFEYLNRIL